MAGGSKPLVPTARFSAFCNLHLYNETSPSTLRPFQYSFLDERIARLYHREVQVSAMISVFSVLAVLLRCMGLFGVASFTVERRRKEIGIRRVLGDTTLGIVSRLASQSASVVLAENILAWPIGLYLMSQWLDQFAYRIDLGIWNFVIAGSGAFLVAMLTVAAQAMRAARANLAEVLRDE